MQKLVRFEGTSPELESELSEILRRNHEEALRNLVTGKTPKKVVYQRPIRGGSQTDYVPGWWFDQQANALFHHLWSHQVVEKYVGENQIWTLDRVTVHVPGSTVIERKPDGTVVETRYDSLNVVKEQFGGSDIKKYTQNPPKGKSVGDVIDIGDDLKSSATDGKKKCLTAFGFAPDIYGQRDTGVTSQLKTLYSVGEKKGMSAKEVDQFSKEEMEKDPESLQSLEVLTLIQKIRELPVKV